LAEQEIKGNKFAYGGSVTLMGNCEDCQRILIAMPGEEKPHLKVANPMRIQMDVELHMQIRGSYWPTAKCICN